MSLGPFDDLCVHAVPEGKRLRPLRDQIVVKVLNFSWSDILIETYRGKPVRGEVVAAGPGRYPWRHYRGDKDGERFHTIKESAHFRPTEVRVGEIVHLEGLERNGVPHPQVLMDGMLHVVVSEQDITGVHD